MRSAHCDARPQDACDTSSEYRQAAKHYERMNSLNYRSVKFYKLLDFQIIIAILGFFPTSN